MSVRRISAAKGFQLATAQAALQTLMADEGPRRFLVADEVGLGKTVVARTIIQEMIKRRRRPLVVFYVSSNLNIAHQNRGKLLEILPTEDEQDAASAAADRLTLGRQSQLPSEPRQTAPLHTDAGHFCSDVSAPRRLGPARRAGAHFSPVEGPVSDARYSLVFEEVQGEPGT